MPRSIEIRARPLGNIQFICPVCGYIHTMSRINWRHGRIRCKHCRRSFRLGMAFSKMLPAAPPYNAVYIEEPSGKHDPVNTVGIPFGMAAIGRIAGHIQWQCPTCHAFADKGQKPRWDACDITCLRCGETWYIALIIRRASTSGRITPVDWIPPDAYDSSFSAPADHALPPPQTGT